MDCAAVCLPCCVGMCYTESRWLGVRRMLRNEELVMGCVGGYLLYSRVRRGVDIADLLFCDQYFVLVEY